MVQDLERIVSQVIEGDDFLRIVKKERLPSSLDFGHGRDAHISYLKVALDMATSSLGESHPLKDKETFVNAYCDAFDVSSSDLWRDITSKGDMNSRHVNRWIYHSFMDFAFGVTTYNDITQFMDEENSFEYLFGESEEVSGIDSQRRNFYHSAANNCFSDGAIFGLKVIGALSTKNNVIKLLSNTTNSYTTLTPVETERVVNKWSKKVYEIRRYTTEEHVDELVEIFGKDIARRKLQENLIFTAGAYDVMRFDIFGLNEDNSSMIYTPENDENGKLIDRGIFTFADQSGVISSIREFNKNWNPWYLRSAKEENEKKLLSMGAEVEAKEKIIEEKTRIEEIAKAAIVIAEKETRAAMARAEAAEATARAELAEERNELLEAQREREREFSRQILKYANTLINAVGTSDKHGKYNKLSKITVRTNNSAKGFFSQFYDSLILAEKPEEVVIYLERKIKSERNADKRSHLEELLGKKEEIAKDIKGFRLGIGRRIRGKPSINTRSISNFLRNLDGLSKLWPPNLDGRDEDSWNARKKLLDENKEFIQYSDNGEVLSEEMLPIDQHRIKTIKNWYLGEWKKVADKYEGIDGIINNELFLEALGTKIANSANVSRLTMELQAESKETKEIGFYQMSLKELADEAITVAMNDKGESVNYESSFGTLEQDDVYVEGIPFIMKGVIRDLFYNSIDAGSSQVKAEFGRLYEIKNDVLANCQTLTEDQKKMLVEEGEFYFKISDNAGAGKFPLIGPEGKRHKGAIPMTQYLMTGAVPKEYKDGNNLNFSTKVGSGGDGTEVLRDILDFMNAYAFYNPTEKGTDTYIVFTGSELQRDLTEEVEL